VAPWGRCVAVRASVRVTVATSKLNKRLIGVDLSVVIAVAEPIALHINSPRHITHFGRSGSASCARASVARSPRLKCVVAEARAAHEICHEIEVVRCSAYGWRTGAALPF
jgi:hypothetical protein